MEQIVDAPEEGLNNPTDDTAPVNDDHSPEPEAKAERVMGETGISRTQQLKELLSGREGERHAVIVQDFPDPDAISCAFAYVILAEAFGIEAHMLYGGRISHQENIALTNMLDIELVRVENPELIPADRYSATIFVDNQGTTSALTEPFERLGVPVLAVMDHHANQQRLEAPLMDLRPVGACATIMTSYFMDGIMPLKTSKSEHRRLATALMHGIISDTGSMINAKSLDFSAGAFLQPLYDADVLQEIMHQQRNHRVMEVIRAALANRVVREGFSLSGVGAIRAEDRDAIPQAADFLLTEDSVHTAIVYGIVSHEDGAESIQGSMRTTKHSVAPDAFLKEALGKSANGQYYGGGKANAGGFEIPLGFLSGMDSFELSKMKWEAYNAKVRGKFFAKLGLEETRAPV
ncbi:DHH family phosphoesterase [Magnetofaba australis]|uniref:Putative phosphoesterase domain-containing protein n=1 Tax=Magnetofaba australis IT-1 TaxID=1434232 RepID=A0A1Y2K1T4_9PROT|nr:bifunctional oligoribonuclease/PAP phosphatase NrnA [Magnetofaba australis]OSM01978.1 putative phosphoesterase domain-containing protein [Magnetofaba australis IT-1]